MKTIMLTDSAAPRYFRRIKGKWQQIDQPGSKDRLWVIVNNPDETLETFKFPLLFGRDRSSFLKRRIDATFPNSKFRAATVVAGGWINPGFAVINGFAAADTITSRLDQLEIPIAGVWGIAMLFTLMVKRLSIDNIVLVMPSDDYLHILVVKDGAPVLNRCVHRYDDDVSSDVEEIMRTSQHLENRRIFENDIVPPVLYMGESRLANEQLANAGFKLLGMPRSLLPSGEVGYLHSLFEYAISSPRGQLAPLQLRAHHVAEKIRMACYAGCATSLLVAGLYGHGDFRALIEMRGQKQTLGADLKKTASERRRLSERISATGSDPELLRQSTQFAALELDPATTPESIFRLISASIAASPQVRVKSLSFRIPPVGERYCQGHSVIDMVGGKPVIEMLPKSISQGVNSLRGGKPEGSGMNIGAPLRHAEMQFTIMLLGNPEPALQSEIRKRISTILKADKGIQLMQDPVAFSLTNTIRGGIGMENTQTENLWCMSVAWKTNGNLP